MLKLFVSFLSIICLSFFFQISKSQASTFSSIQHTEKYTNTGTISIVFQQKGKDFQKETIFYAFLEKVFFMFLINEKGEVFKDYLEKHSASYFASSKDGKFTVTIKIDNSLILEGVTLFFDLLQRAKINDYVVVKTQNEYYVNYLKNKKKHFFKGINYLYENIGIKTPNIAYLSQKEYNEISKITTRQLEDFVKNTLSKQKDNFIHLECPKETFNIVNKTFFQEEKKIVEENIAFSADFPPSFEIVSTISNTPKFYFSCLSIDYSNAFTEEYPHNFVSFLLEVSISKKHLHSQYHFQKRQQGQYCFKAKDNKSPDLKKLKKRVFTLFETQNEKSISYLLKAYAIQNYLKGEHNSSVSLPAKETSESLKKLKDNYSIQSAHNK